MATDSGTATADAPPPPPPPPPPPESQHQRSADLQSSRVPAGEKAAEPQGLEPRGLQPTPEFQQKLDAHTEAKAARQDGAPNAQQSADLQSSRVPPADPVADRPPAQPDPVAERPPAQADSVAERPPAQADSVADRPPAQPDPVAERPPAQPDPVGDRPPAQPDPVADRPPAQPDPVGDRPPAQPDPVGERPPAQPDPVAKPADNTVVEPANAVRPADAAEPVGDSRPSEIQQARPTEPTEPTSEADQTQSTPVESVDPAHQTRTPDQAQPAVTVDAAQPTETVDRTQSAVTEPVEPVKTALFDGVAETAADGTADPLPQSSGEGARPPGRGGDAPATGPSGDGAGAPPSGPPSGGGDMPPAGPPGSGGGPEDSRSPADAVERPRDPGVVSTFLPPNGNEQVQPRVVAGDGAFPGWQDDNGTKNPMRDYREAVQQLAKDGTPLSPQHAALHDAVTSAPAPGETLYKGGQVPESTVDAWKAGLDRTEHGGEAPALSLDTSSVSSSSTIAEMYADATDHASQRLGVSDGVPKAMDASAAVDPGQPVPGYEHIATESRFEADYAKEMSNAVRDGNTARIEQLETVRDKVGDRIRDVPHLEGARRANLDESVLSGDYELVGLVDTRPGHEYSRGEVSTVQPPGGEPVPPGVYPIWRPAGG